MRLGLRTLLGSQRDMEVVREVADHETAIACAVALKPTVVVLELSLQHGNAIATASAIKRNVPDTAVVAWMRHHDDTQVGAFVSAGLGCYARTETDTANLLRAIRESHVQHVTVMRQPRRGTSSNRRLSAREHNVLQLVARGYTHKAIGDALRLSVKTVEAHKANAMRKLALTDRVGIMHYAVRHGWLDN